MLQKKNNSKKITNGATNRPQMLYCHGIWSLVIGEIIPVNTLQIFFVIEYQMYQYVYDTQLEESGNVTNLRIL